MSQGTPKTPAIVKAQKAKTPGNDPFKRITGMTPERRQLVDSLLLVHSPAQVAEVMQVDWGESTDIARVSLSHVLEKYRTATIPIDKILNPFMVGRLTEKVRRSVNALAAMSDLLELQQERLRYARIEELEKGVLTPSVDKQVTLTNRLLRNYSDLAYKAGLIDLFTSDFKRVSAEEEEQFEFSLGQLYWKTMRRIFEGETEENIRQLLFEVNSEE